MSKDITLGILGSGQLGTELVRSAKKIGISKIIVLSDFIDSWSALIDFSLPTNNGTTIEGKITMSLRGKRGFR